MALLYPPTYHHSFTFTQSDRRHIRETIRTHYTLTQDYINLESGYYNIIPNPTLERLQQHLQRTITKVGIYAQPTGKRLKYAETTR